MRSNNTARRYRGSEDAMKQLVKLCEHPSVRVVKGVYFLIVGLTVAAYFVISATQDTETDGVVWSVIDILLLIAVFMLVLSTLHWKLTVPAGDSVTRGYLEANISFYLTVAFGLGLVYNYLAWKVNPSTDPYDASSYILWLTLDVVLALLLISNGIRLLRSVRSE